MSYAAGRLEAVEERDASPSERIGIPSEKDPSKAVQPTYMHKDSSIHVPVL